MAMTRNGTNGTVVGVFQDELNARSAMEELRNLGFAADRMGVAGRDWRGEATVGTEVDSDYAGEGTAAGAVAGAGLGALWGLGIAAGVMPVLGPALAGGTLAAILSSAAAGAAAAGLGGALIGMGIPKDDVEFYETEFHAGRIIVTVSAPGREVEASDVIVRNGGYTRAHALQA